MLVHSLKQLSKNWHIALKTLKITSVVWLAFVVVILEASKKDFSFCGKLFYGSSYASMSSRSVSAIQSSVQLEHNPAAPHSWHRGALHISQ